LEVIHQSRVHLKGEKRIQVDYPEHRVQVDGFWRNWQQGILLDNKGILLDNKGILLDSKGILLDSKGILLDNKGVFLVFLGKCSSSMEKDYKNNQYSFQIKLCLNEINSKPANV
jgi:hypothetical protein